MDPQSWASEEEELSYLVSNGPSGVDGLCCNYELRRHRYEHLADEGAQSCRDDWVKYIGPLERWGCCNPWEGNFGSVVLPLCKPERLALMSYIFEFAFIYDNVLESESKPALDAGTDNLVLEETEYRTVRSTTGPKQIQSKMLLQLLSVDPGCGKVVVDAWKEMVSTTAHRDKTCIFDNMEEYVDYRIVDTGAPFVETLMRFGMGILLTDEEEAIVAPIMRPCFAALGLANDYYSFDVEWEGMQTKENNGTMAMTNLVWLFMSWEGLSIPDAKERARQTVREYEEDFRQQVNDFIDHSDSPKLARHLKALAFQIPGNIAWSLRCPRYHQWLCAEAESILKAGKESNELFQNGTGSSSHGAECPDSAQSEFAPSQSAFASPRSNPSSMSSVPSVPLDKESRDVPEVKEPIQLGSEHLLAPYEYISSIPSKGFRESLIDALNVWLGLPGHMVKTVKAIAQKLYNSSLLLDDIEDYSSLRRRQPAAHTVFGSPQTINCANFMIIDTVKECQKLGDPQCTSILVEELQNLFLGQSVDLHWTRHLECPSEEEYLEMVNQKTGGLFRLLARLMSQRAHSLHGTTIDLDLVSFLGQYFQIRDDYMNLMDDMYTKEKGFCEDLDEGKFSFPLIHTLQSNPSDRVLRGVLHERRSSVSDSMPAPHKKLVLDSMHQAGSLEHTLKTLEGLKKDIFSSLEMVESGSGINWVMRMLIHRLLV